MKRELAPALCATVVVKCLALLLYFPSLKIDLPFAILEIFFPETRENIKRRLTRKYLHVDFKGTVA